MELKPCPFCGGKAEYHSSVETIPEIDENGAYVDCIDIIYREETGCPACDIWFYNGDDDPEEITIERWNRRATMYDDLVKRLIDYSAARKGEIAELTGQAADAIEDLEYALLLMVLQYCTTDDGLLYHEFMSAGENAFAVLGLKNGQQEDPLWCKMDRMMQSASERISAKTAPKEET